MYSYRDLEKRLDAECYSPTVTLTRREAQDLLAELRCHKRGISPARHEELEEAKKVLEALRGRK